MVAEDLAHFAGDVFGRVLKVDGGRATALKGDRIQFDMPKRTSCTKTRVIDDHSIGL